MRPLKIGACVLLKIITAVNFGKPGIANIMK